ncbi:hypothetical protein DL93DRAFT_1490841 [Clavulina sp. PMI_390]|nr:hypothetical protein DL93DRAFT_1490841 [Clavulina sp. PMI_390]
MSVLQEDIPSDTVPLLGGEVSQNASTTRQALWSLRLQHFSNAWGTRMAEFAIHLYLIVHFKNTLLPNALYGFSSCIVNILFSQRLGSLVDRVPKLLLVRTCVAIQKLSAFAAYATFCAMFSLESTAPGAVVPVIPAMGLIILSGCLLQLSNTCITIAVERDWVTCIAEGSPDRLSALNAQMKQIDLSCKLLAPLFVSALSTFMPYLYAAMVMATIQLVTFGTELLWLGIVYQNFPALEEDQRRRQQALSLAAEEGRDVSRGSPFASFVRGLQNWAEFVKLPVFKSSLAVSFLYMTVLSFDGTMLSYLKTQGYSDASLSIMRGVNVVTGLGGTAIAPWLERRLGSVRSGNWSIWFEAVCLIPAVIALESSWSKRDIGVATLLFGGMALSRIGLWSFDLIQMKQLQLSLEDHPRRNTLTSLQFSLQNSADLLKYILTMVFWRPSDFKWTALFSFFSVLSGAATYSLYVRTERGHLFHFEWLSMKRGRD